MHRLARRLTAVLSAGFLLSLLAGCGAPRFDATSEATANASLKAIGAALGDDGKRQLSVDLMTVSMPQIMKGSFARKAADRPSTKPNDLFKSLDAHPVDPAFDAAMSEAAAACLPLLAAADRLRALGADVTLVFSVDWPGGEAGRPGET